jgi:hypothetical protein
MSLTDCDARALTASSIFNGPLENLLHFQFRNVVQLDMRLACFGIEIESQVHGGRIPRYRSDDTVPFWIMDASLTG